VATSAFAPGRRADRFVQRSARGGARRFQRRNRLAVDGIVNPEDETIQALERESFGREDADERRREAACVQNRVRLANLRVEIDEASGDLEAASTTVVALSEEADRRNARHDLQLAIMVISNAFPAARAIRAGLGIVAVLREFARGAVPDIPQLTAAWQEAGDLAERFESATQNLEFQNAHLTYLLKKIREVLQTKTALHCA